MSPAQGVLFSVRALPKYQVFGSIVTVDLYTKEVRVTVTLKNTFNVSTV